MATIRVRAKTRGFYRQVMNLPKDDRMLRPAGRHAKSVEVQKGDVFDIDDAAFSSTWMERVGVQDLERDAKAARAKANEEAKEAEAAEKKAAEAKAKADKEREEADAAAKAAKDAEDKAKGGKPK